MLRNVCFIVCVLFMAPLKADNAWFVAAKVGNASPVGSYQETTLNLVKFDFNSGIDYTLSVGKDFEKFMLEFEYSTRDFDANSRIIPSTGDIEPMAGHQEQQSIFINGYIKQMVGESTSVYMGFGIGQTDVKWRGVTTSGFAAIINSGDTVDSYKTMLGTEIRLSDLLSMNVTFQYLLLDDVELSLAGSPGGKFNNQDLKLFNIGLKYRF